MEDKIEIIVEIHLTLSFGVDSRINNVLIYFVLKRRTVKTGITNLAVIKILFLVNGKEKRVLLEKGYLRVLAVVFICI